MESHVRRRCRLKFSVDRGRPWVEAGVTHRRPKRVSSGTRGPLCYTDSMSHLKKVHGSVRLFNRISTISLWQQSWSSNESRHPQFGAHIGVIQVTSCSVSTVVISEILWYLIMSGTCTVADMNVSVKIIQLELLHVLKLQLRWLCGALF